MFSLLSTFSLWLGAALVVPLAIHFLGVQRQKKIFFPSLLLVRERFSKSMHRHRLKNLLLLLIRTLLILCLLLALANPLFNSQKARISNADNSLVLIHNGIYGKLPSTKGTNLLEAQKLRYQELDSSESKPTQALAMVAQNKGLWEISERYGDYSEAIKRMLSEQGSRPGTTQFHIPVFDWSEFLPVKETLLRALKENPGLQIALTDYGDAAQNTQAITGLKSLPSHEGPTAKIVVKLNPDLDLDQNLASPNKVRVFLDGRLYQEIAPLHDRIDLTLPLGQSRQTLGKFQLAGAGMANPEYHYCFSHTGSQMRVHAGSILTSLPSLGKEAYFQKILHVNGIKDIPWMGKTEIGLIYLAHDRMVDAGSFAKVVEFVKRGGRLILGVGETSDIPSLNRFLLQPLRVGRLGNKIESSSNATLTLNRRGLADLGKLPQEVAYPAKVRKAFAFAPDSGTEVLISFALPSSSSSSGSGSGSGSEKISAAILTSQTYYRGKVLLWTTDIDNLDWTDLGISPLTPLLHQALQESGLEPQAQNFSVASDSTLTLPVEEKFKSTLQILDPDLRPFSQVRGEGRKLQLGPFNKLGIYRKVQGLDTTHFAVNLASTAPAKTPSLAREKGDWKEKNLQAKMGFLEAFKSHSGRLIVLGDQDPLVAQTKGRALWPFLLLASILLLFLEGLIASTFSLRRSRT